MGVRKVEQVGNFLVAIKSDDSRTKFTDIGGGIFRAATNSVNLHHIQIIGNHPNIVYNNGKSQLGYPSTGGLWFADPNFTGGDPPVLVDTISPGHAITNPGGTIESGWNWHLANEAGGGDDWNYAYGTNFKAPGAGTVRHFDVSGVGMCVVLKLDTPAVRTHPQFTSDANGPMTDIWFEHCSDANDGHANEGDVIGKSGDGYGAYPAHLHVHGLINDGNSAPSGSRCCFWNFLP